jgi:hypothetical protein
MHLRRRLGTGISKRDKGKFEPRPLDFYPTPLAAALPLIPYLRNEGIECFAEPCAGEGDLVRHLESFGFNCVHSSDLNCGQDALGLVHYGNADAIVTNPPHTRKTMHALIRHFLRSEITVWLLIDTDWAFTQQAAPYLPHCSDIVTIGRVIWIDGTTTAATTTRVVPGLTPITLTGRSHWWRKAEQAATDAPLLPLDWVHGHAAQAARARGHD